MSPRDIQQQTYEILQCLLDDDEDLSSVRQMDSGLEVDNGSSGDVDNTFDPVLIADKLKEVADKFNHDQVFQEAARTLGRAASDQAMQSAFSHGVDALCKQHVAQQPEVAPELHLIRVSVALGLYIRKNSPELTGQLQGVMAAFLNTRVGEWLSQHGGWKTVGDAGC